MLYINSLIQFLQQTVEVGTVIITPVLKARKLRLISLSHLGRRGWSLDLSPGSTTWPPLQNVIYEVVVGSPKVNPETRIWVQFVWDAIPGQSKEVGKSEQEGNRYRSHWWPGHRRVQLASVQRGTSGPRLHVNPQKGQPAGYLASISCITGWSRLLGSINSRYFLPATGHVLSRCWRKPPDTEPHPPAVWSCKWQVRKKESG